MDLLEYWSVYDENGVYLTNVGVNGTDCGGWYSTIMLLHIVRRTMDIGWKSIFYIVYPSSTINHCTYNDVMVTFTIGGTTLMLNIITLFSEFISTYIY